MKDIKFEYKLYFFRSFLFKHNMYNIHNKPFFVSKYSKIN